MPTCRSRSSRDRPSRSAKATTSSTTSRAASCRPSGGAVVVSRDPIDHGRADALGAFAELRLLLSIRSFDARQRLRVPPKLVVAGNRTNNLGTFLALNHILIAVEHLPRLCHGHGKPEGEEPKVELHLDCCCDPLV